MDQPLQKLRTRLGELQLFASPESRRRFLVHLLVVIAIFGVVTVLVRRHFAFLTDVAGLRTFIQGYGVLAPVVLVVLQALQVVVAPVPGQVLAVVAGYLFGPWWGTLYNMIGITIGSTVAFWLSRRFGREYVEGIVHEDALARFDAIDDESAGLSLFFLFLLPGLPDDVLCFAGGLTTIPLWKLVVIAILGRAPAFFLVNVVGGFLGTGRLAAAGILTAVLVALSVAGYLNRDRLLRLLAGDR